MSLSSSPQFLEERHRDTPSRNAQLMRQFYQRFLNIRNLQVPVVAAINGPAVGAGLCFALACDVRDAVQCCWREISGVDIALEITILTEETVQQVKRPFEDSFENPFGIYAHVKLKKMSQNQIGISKRFSNSFFKRFNNLLNRPPVVWFL